MSLDLKKRSEKSVALTFNELDANWTAIEGSVNAGNHLFQALYIPVGDETTSLSTGNGKAVFRMPYGFTLTEVRASVTTAPTGANIIIDLSQNSTGSPVAIFSTKLTIDDGEKTSTTAATPAVISDGDLDDDAEISVDIDQVGSTIAGAGLKIWLIGNITNP